MRQGQPTRYDVIANDTFNEPLHPALLVADDAEEVERRASSSPGLVVSMDDEVVESGNSSSSSSDVSGDGADDSFEDAQEEDPTLDSAEKESAEEPTDIIGRRTTRSTAGVPPQRYSPSKS